MPITLLHWTVIGIYTAIFIIIVIFFEIRLNYIHRRHIDKISPIGEDGLRKLDRRLKIIVRIIFIILYIISLSLIFAIL